MHPPSVNRDRVLLVLEPLVVVNLRNEITRETKLVQVG
jgi:hypothetical protein